MKKIFVVIAALLVIPIFAVWVAGSGSSNSVTADPYSTPAATSTLAKQARTASGYVAPPIRDQVDRVFIASPPTPTREPVSFGNPSSGEKLFTLACGKCHGRKRDGSLALRVDVLTNDLAAKEANQELFEIIRTGRNAAGTRLMPPRGGNSALTDEDLYDIVAFIRSLDQ
jgi:mono/diheme cytochrome c family protein